MAIRPFLAMTAAEIRKNPQLPVPIAWMACHFSPYGTCASNLPRALPPGSLLILDDITPIHGHDPEEIAIQLADCVQQLHCSGVLLDFQRTGCDETAALAAFLAEQLPCPTAVSEPYAQGLSCPVFLPPVPLDMSLAKYLKPWHDREIWLEMALDGIEITLTPSEARSTPLPPVEKHDGGYSEETLHCHYHIHLSDEQARFTLFRTQEDFDKLLKKAEELGVTTAVGLYQELQSFYG